MNDILNFLAANKDTIAVVVGLATFLVGVGKYFLDAKNERASIQIGFLVEIERLLWVIENHLKEFKNFKDEPLIPFTTDFYDKQIQNVGKIEQDLIPDIIRFYGYVKFLNQIQVSRPGYTARAAFNSFYEIQLQSFLRQFEPPFKKHFLRYEITPPLHRGGTQTTPIGVP